MIKKTLPEEAGISNNSTELRTNPPLDLPSVHTGLSEYLVGVRQQQDLCDGGWRQDGIEGWELSARGRLQLYFHHLGNVETITQKKY